MIELTIKLDDEAVKAAISKAWGREFAEPGYRDGGGTGWQEVVKQVKGHIATLDLREQIAIAARSQLSGVITNVVAAALREETKKQVKEMTKAGTLL